MPWNDQPGNNGGNGGGRGPWGQPPGGNGQGEGPRDPRRPGDRPGADDPLRAARMRFRRTGGPNGGSGGGGVPNFEMPSRRVLGIGALVLIGAYLASGAYTVSSGARGVITTFGAFTSVSSPGLNWHLPWPIQDRRVVLVDRDTEVQIGRSQGTKISMLTSDLNIVDVDMTVSYKIRADGAVAAGELPNAAKFVFNVENPESLVRSATESALREVVGANEFEQIITRGRNIVNEQTATILQQILDDYDSGIEIIRVNFTQADPPQAVIPDQRLVIDAASSAEREVNDANGYFNRVVPQARGEARQLVLDAEAYAARVVSEAVGQASRFNDIYAEYARAPEVTRRRMYLETMEEVLGRMNKIVIDENAGGTVPYINLSEIIRDRAARPATPNTVVGQ